jgi:hypothetical protein
MILPVVLGILGVGIFVTSLAMAAPSQALSVSSSEGSPTFDGVITDTDTISPTDHPVVSAMAGFFANVLEEDQTTLASDISALHEEGYGFGVISHAYFVALKLDEIQPRDLLDLFDSGMGWGQILKEHTLHPGIAGRGGNLGSIMSNRIQSSDSWMPPGQAKKDPMGEGDAFVPPGQAKKDRPTEEDPEFVPPSQLRGPGRDDGDSHGGPPASPPGKGKDKGKGGGKK